MNKRLQRIRYIAFDFIASALAWTFFFIYRKAIVEPEKYGYKIPIFEFDRNYLYAIILIPVFWLIIFWLFGSYRNIYRKSRVRELGQTFLLSFIGTIIIFFTLLVDDEVHSHIALRYTFLTYLSLQFFCVFTLRFILLSIVKYKLNNRIIGFNTLMVGSSHNALELYNELENKEYSQGYRFLGYLNIKNETGEELSRFLKPLGNYHRIREIIKEYKIEEVILAVESTEHHLISHILTMLEDQKVHVKVIPDMYDIITGSVRMNYIFGTALIEVNTEIMPVWQKNLKRIIDIFTAIFILTLGSPLYALVALGVKLSSKGPVFYKQERIGIYGEPFLIYKFRTMYTDAEKHGPKLSSDFDPRVTPIGRFLRKYRLDEFPQFWNVLIGDMSLVGPRPERQFFIDQIVKIAPHYPHLHKVKPGITSWGQIKFGYAENVDEMVERMKFDILYIENMSIAMDFKILFYTILIMLQGRGK